MPRQALRDEAATLPVSAQRMIVGSKCRHLKSAGLNLHTVTAYQTGTPDLQHNPRTLARRTLTFQGDASLADSL